MIPESGVRVGLVSRELANDRGIPEVFFGTVPVCRNPYALYGSLRDEGDVLRDVGCDCDTPCDRTVCRTTELERWCSGDACELGEKTLRLERAKTRGLKGGIAQYFMLILLLIVVAFDK